MNATMNRQRLTALSWLFGAAALVAGCGGGDVDTPPSAGAPPPAPPPAPQHRTRTCTCTCACDRSRRPRPASPKACRPGATIGAAGGTLASSDGRLSIRIPAGALAADTAVGIQPITATAPRRARLGVPAHARGHDLRAAGDVDLHPLGRGSRGQRGRTAARGDSAGRWALARGRSDGRRRATHADGDDDALQHLEPSGRAADQARLPAVLLVNKTVGLRVLDCGEAQDGDLTLLRECQECRTRGCATGPSTARRGNARQLAASYEGAGGGAGTESGRRERRGPRRAPSRCRPRRR